MQICSGKHHKMYMLTYVEHCSDRREGNIAQFAMNVTEMFRDDAMLRQVTEFVKYRTTD